MLASGLSGCGKELIKSLGDMQRLQAELINEFHEPNINVVIRNSNMLGVTFINSTLNEESSLKRRERAQATAFFIRGHYVGIDHIERLVVSFSAAKTRFLVFHYTRGIDTFVFDEKGVFVGPPVGFRQGPEPFSDEDVSASYNDRRKETDVQITRLQLSGDLNRGLALAPHFTLPGNALASAQTTKPPRTITFTFASYAPRKVFNTDVPFAVIADGNTIYTSISHNTSTTTKGGNEFLTQELPFPQFLAMTRAEKATLKLADKEFHLTDTQLAALRAMANYAPWAQP